MGDTWKLIDDRKDAMTGFYKQVDNTRKRLNLTPFEMIDPLSKAPMDDVVIVTENKSVTYTKRIIAGLMSSNWQTVVEGSITDKEARKIEQFIEDNLEQADEYILSKYGLAGLDTWLTNHVCHTSLIGVQWMSFLEDKQYKIHCLPVDMRWTPFVLNKFAAPITFRSKDDLLQELDDYEKFATDRGLMFNRPANLKDNDNEVRDYWDEKKGELWVEKQMVFSQKNPYGTLPFVFVWPPTGFLFRDKGYLARESPSLLYLNENLYDQLSRQLTIDATLGFNILNPPMEYETDNPATDRVSRPTPRRGETQEVPTGELHRPVPTPDINRAELASREQVSRLMDEATPMTPRTYTTPPSAIEVATEVELLDELQNPRIIALQMFKEQLARLIIAQAIVITKGGSLEIGKQGKKHNFSLDDLKDPKRYTVSYRLMKQNKRLAIVNESRALALWGKAPMKYILRDVLSVEDPDGWEREMELEKAKQANPAISLAEMAVRYAEEAEETEGTEQDLKNWQSMMLVHDYVMLMRQRMQPAQPAESQNLREATKESGNAGGLIKMLGQGGGALGRLP